MKDEQFEILMSTLSVNKNKNALWDSLEKIGIALCTAGIVWAVSQLTALDKTLAVVVQSQADMRENIKKLDEFSNDPRFTEKDFDMRIAPVIQRLEMQQQSFQSIGESFKDMKGEIRNLSQDINSLKRKK